MLSAATEGGETAEPEHSPLQQLKTDPGRVGLDNALEVISKLQQLRQLNLPQDLFRHVAPRLLQRYRQRAAVENAYEICCHPASLRYSLIAAYCWLRAQEITDDLIESLIQIIHRIGATAERRVERELMIQRVLTEPDWTQRMLPDDLRALTPLIYAHVTPYGIFRLDMSQRLAIEQDAVAA